MKKQLILIALAATLINALAGCTATGKARLRADGKSIVRIVEGAAIRLGEAELQQLINDAQK